MNNLEELINKCYNKGLCREYLEEVARKNKIILAPFETRSYTDGYIGLNEWLNSNITAHPGGELNITNGSVTYTITQGNTGWTNESEGIHYTYINQEF